MVRPWTARLRVCGTAVVASIAAAGGCLSDPAPIDTLCTAREGGPADPDGVLERGEQCDDGNAEDGDGCDRTCRVRCDPPDVLDAKTLHCYRAVAGTTAGAAAGKCRALAGGAWRLATVRSDGERDAVLRLVNGGGTLVTAYRTAAFHLALGLDVDGTGAVTSVAYGEPGLFSGGTTAAGTIAADACSGCYGTAGGSWTTNGDLVVVSAGPSNDLAYADAPDGAAVSGALCELVPAGAAPTVCGPCPSGANLALAVDGVVYEYFGVPATIDDAAASCAAAGETLVFFADENERERVVRAFGPNLRTTPTWVGLRKAGETWTWSDGVADGGGRAKLWAIDPSALADASLGCAVLVPATGSTWAGGLLAPVRCGGDEELAAEQAYLCKR